MHTTAHPGAHEPEPMAFADILADELKALRPGFQPGPRPSVAGLTRAIDALPEPQTALCLSGGGIRSAAFALGVLQALARFGVLGEFHYLSTVSGGGYIGSWLTAWRHHAASDAAVWAGLDRPGSPTGDEAGEIGDLRANGNYLTPRLGVLSPDTWTVLTLYFRNLVLNWLVFGPVFLGALFVPMLCQHVLDRAVCLPTAAARAVFGLGLLALAAGLAAASYGRRHAAGLWLTDGRFVRFVLVPIITASMAFSLALPRWFADTGGAVSWGGAIGVGTAGYALIWLAVGAVRPQPRTPITTRRAPRPHAEEAKDCVAWAMSGAVVGALLALGVRLYAGQGWLRAPASLAVLGIAWVMLSILLGELIYVGLRSYSSRGDMDREWLARAAGWLAAAAVTWSAGAAISLFGPDLLTWSIASLGVWVAGGLSGVAAIVLGSGAKTAATQAAALARGLTRTQIASIAGVVFAVFLGIVLSLADQRLCRLISEAAPAVPLWAIDAVAGTVLVLAGTGISWFVNVNRFSLHALYRNRLVRAFLGAARAGAAPARDPDPFTGFDPADNLAMADLARRGPHGCRLLHVVNIALNVVSSRRLAWQERKAESFTITPLASGNPNVGYRPTAAFGNPRGGISLGTAMAISGAAVSPNMGYHSSPLLGVLLMLFNVRLGWWLGNPRGRRFRQDGPELGIVPVLQELAGQTDDTGEWIYLSDGGHFDNLGLYEMIRRRCRLIVVSDAGCDPLSEFADLGETLRKIYIDFGVSVDFAALDLAARKTPPEPGVYCAVAAINYPGSEDDGWLLYIKPGFHGDEPAHVRSYALAHPSFPHEPTSEQWFGESQFEAYRALGAHVMERICAGGTAPRPGARPEAIDLRTLQARAASYLSAWPRPGCTAC